MWVGFYPYLSFEMIFILHVQVPYRLLKQCSYINLWERVQLCTTPNNLTAEIAETLKMSLWENDIEQVSIFQVLPQYTTHPGNLGH